MAKKGEKKSSSTQDATHHVHHHISHPAHHEVAAVSIPHTTPAQKPKKQSLNQKSLQPINQSNTQF